ncbi:MAG TPA: hypothetical protein VN222_07125, partial [Novosphingobium sp.]|nr:hypothetical protein [Novosphingobium sp.]
MPAFARAASRWPYAIAFLAVVDLFIYFLLSGHLFAPYQIDYSEGWNAMRQSYAARHVPLYGAPPHFDVTNYPPLSFHLVALVSGIAGWSVNFTGRLLSLGGMCVQALLAGALVDRLTRHRAAAHCTVALYLLVIALWAPVRIAENDPQPIGMALEMLGFWLALGDEGQGKRFLASAPLFALAVFFKPNLIGMALGVGGSLVWARSWRQLVLWCLIGLTCAAALYGATVHVDGPYFLKHLLWPRDYIFADVRRLTGAYLRSWLVFVCIGACWLLGPRLTMAERALALAWVAAHGLAIALAGGDGVAENIFLETLWLDCIVAVVALTRLDALVPARHRRKAVMALVVLCLLPFRLAPPLVAQALVDRAASAERADDYARGVAEIRGGPGKAVCENLLLCAEAGK